MPAEDLKAHLERLCAATDHRARIAADPVEFPRRYPERRDAEIAGFLAAGLAFGRVGLFKPVVRRVLERADAMGGPRAWVEGFDPATEAPYLEPIQYRWILGSDLILLFATLRRALDRWGDLESVYAAGWEPEHETVKQALAVGSAALLAEARAAAGVHSDADLPRGLRYFFVSPAGGSACKRLNMYLRWMVRPTTEGVDMGHWGALPTRALVLPLDTHTSRLSRFLGLTRRQDGSWRTAAEITAALRGFDPVDPIRYDFALAHLGISRGCLGRRDAEVCPTCPLDPVCAA